MVSRRYELTDGQCDKIKHYFEDKKGRPYKNVKNTVNGIVWIMRSGAAGRDLPARYGTWNAVYKCFCTWQESGLFEKIITVAASLLADLRTNIVMADAAYDSAKLRKQIAAQGAFACIKPRRNRKVHFPFDKEQYKERQLPLFTLLAFLSAFFNYSTRPSLFDSFSQATFPVGEIPPNPLLGGHPRYVDSFRLSREIYLLLRLV